MTNLLKLGKKIFTVGVVATTIFWSLGVAALVPAVANAATETDCATLMAGDLVKTTASPVIYVVNADKTKSYFPQGDVFKSWTGDNKYSYKTIAQTCLTSLKSATAVLPRPGTYLVKEAAADTVYTVLPGNKLSPMTVAAATALYGASYAKTPAKGGRTITMDDPSWTFYSQLNPTFGAQITETAPTEGSLVKVGTTYYVVGAAKTLSEVTATGLTANRFQTKFAHTLTATTGFTMSATKLEAQDAVLTDRTQGAKGAVGTTTGPVVSGNVTVSLAANTPAAGTVVAGQAIADLAHFNFSGTGTVTSLKVKRLGVSADATLNNVYLYDGVTKLTDAGSLSNGVVTFSNGAGLFTVNGSKTISVKADILAAVSGETVAVSINSASDVGGTTAGGTFPVSGNTFSVNSAILASVNFATTTATGPGATITAGTNNATLWQAAATVGTRAVSLSYVALKEIGSVPTDAFTNLQLYVNGVKVATGALDTNNVLAFDLSAAPVALNTGSRTLEVRGDVVKGSSRTFSFTLQNASDIVLVDSSYGVNVSATALSTTFSAVAAITTTISSGSVTITTDPSFTTTQVVKNSSGVTLGKWLLKAYGEDEKVMSLKVTSTTVGATQATEKINNLAIFVNGSQVGSSQTWTLSPADSSKTFGSGNLFTIAAGQTATVEVRGDLSLVDATTLTGIRMNLVVLANQFQGNTSFATSPAADTTYSAASTLSIVAGTVSLNKNSAFNSMNVAPNGSKVKVGSYTLKAGNADTVRVTSMNVGITGSFGTANLANLYTSENAAGVSPQASNNFSTDFTLKANEIRTIDVFADIGNATGTIVTTLGVTAQNGTGSDASQTNQTGQTITVGAGTLAYPSSIVIGSLSSQYVLGGSTQPSFTVYNFVASNAPVVIDELGFTFGGSSVANTDEPITSLTISGKDYPVVGHAVTVTDLALTVPVGYGGLDLAVAAKFNTAGLNGITSGLTATSTLTYVKYHSGNTTASNSALTVQSNAVTVTVSKPSLGVVATADKLVNGLVKVGSVMVSADAAGDILVKNVPITINGTTATISTSSIAAGTLVVKDSAEQTVAAVTSTVMAAGASATDFILNFNGYKIAAGKSQTFGIYVTAASVSGAVNTCSLTSKLGSASLFTWTDVSGNYTGGTGTLLYGYPSGSMTVSN